MLSLLLSYLLSVTVSLSGSGRVMVEIPDSLMGRKICMAARVLEISDPGEAVSGQVSETCLPLVFKENDGFVDVFQLIPGVAGDSSEGLFKRLKPFSSTPGSTTLDLTELFTGEYSGLRIYPSTAYNSNGGSVMRTHIPVPGQALVESVFNEDDCSGAVCDISYKMEGHLYGMFKVEGDFSLRARVAKFFFVPEDGSPLQFDNSWKYGARTFTLPVLESELKGIEDREYVFHRNLSSGIGYVIDSLMPEPWINGIERAVAEWNTGLTAVGAGPVLSCRLENGSGRASDYLSDMFSYVASGMESYECTMLADPLDGTIFSTTTVLHSSYISKLCFQYMADMASSDPRARADALPDEVVSDIVCAVALQAIGRSLGLSENPAASFSCPADSLKSCAFTARFGVSLSAMEAPVFNYIASEDDIRSGVASVQTRLTPYDLAAVAAHYGLDYEPCGTIRYSSNRDESGAYVPYALRGDLSSEPVNALGYLEDNQKILLAHLDEWFSDSKVRDMVASVSRGTYARFLVRLTDYLKGDFPDGPARTDVIMKVMDSLRNASWLGDEPSEMMYRRNIFTSMVSVAAFPDDLEYIYSNIRKEETEWMDILATRLAQLAGLDALKAGVAPYADPATDGLAAISYVLLERMRRETSDDYLKTRLDNLL